MDRLVALVRRNLGRLTVVVWLLHPGRKKFISSIYRNVGESIFLVMANCNLGQRTLEVLFEGVGLDQVERQDAPLLGVVCRG